MRREELFQAIGQIDDLAVYVVLYMDKSGFGPMFVETMVLRMTEFTS